jgi:hypothetical protein
MKMKERIFILLLTGLCAAVFAQNENDYEFNPDDGAITGYSGSGPEVIIPVRIKGVPVTYISNSVFKDKNLTSVSIPDNIKGIGSQAFTGNKLEKVIIGSDVDIMTSAFQPDFLRKYLDDPARAGGTYTFADNEWGYNPAGVRTLASETAGQSASSQQLSPINIVIHNYVGKQPPAGMPVEGGNPTDTTVQFPPSAPQQAAVNPTAVGNVMVMPGLPDPNGNKMYRLQVGAFNSQNAAAHTFRSLQDAGFNPVYEHSQNFFRVIVADVPASGVANTVQRLGAIGIRQIWVRE